MKKIILTLGCLLILKLIFAQEGILSLTVKDLKGQAKNIAEYVAPDGLTIFVFWKTCCPNNLEMLTRLQESMPEEGQEETPLRFVLVSVDDTRSAGRVRPIVGAYGWKGEVILDGNQELARRMNAIVPPQWLVMDPKGREVFRCKITSANTDVDIYLEEIKNIH